MSDAPRNLGPTPWLTATGGQAWTIPEPTKRSLFSLSYLKLVVRRLNALIRMEAKSASAPGPLLVTDVNSILPVAGTAGSASTPAGGSGQQLFFQSMQADYIICLDGDSNTVNVAKPDYIREPATEVFPVPGGGSITNTYSAYDKTYQTRTASDGVNADETQQITPRYLLNSRIYAMTVDSTGVTVSGTELTLIDTSGRAYARVNLS
jgi:hypothetical protein